MNPLTEIPEWSIIDPSKLQALMTCLRRFFYEYVLGWRLDMNNIHLVFGLSWHDAQAYLLQHGYSIDEVNAAHELFLLGYSKAYTNKDTLTNSPKNADRAFLALCDYTGYYRNDVTKFKNIGVELPARVNIGGYQVVGRLDSVNEYLDGRGIFSLEHKTGTTFNDFWVGQWDTSIQVGIYYHILNTVYGIDNVYGIIVNGVFFHKVKDDSTRALHDFHRYHVRKNADQVHAIYLDALGWLNMWDKHMNMMLDTSIGDPVMAAFPRNCKSCASYGKMCPYKDFCHVWTNPLQHLDTIPMGFRVEHWNPLADVDNDKVVEI